MAKRAPSRFYQVRKRHSRNLDKTGRWLLIAMAAPSMFTMSSHPQDHPHLLLLNENVVEDFFCSIPISVEDGPLLWYPSHRGVCVCG